MMQQLIVDAVRSARDRMLKHASLVGLPNTDEATFRSFFIAELKSRCPEARCQTEWHYIDLLVQVHNQNALIEFKYYVHRRHFDLDGKGGEWKSGAGAQPEREYQKDIQQLHHDENAPVHAKYLILVYEPVAPSSRKKSFDTSFRSLAAAHPVKDVRWIARGDDGGLACALITIV